MAHHASRSSKSSSLPVRADNVVLLRQKILPCHQLILSCWLEAGYRMGLLDACVAPFSHHDVLPEGPKQVLVWTRDHASPAYIIRPQNQCWQLLDNLQNREIGRYRCFNTVLNNIVSALPNRARRTHSLH